MAEPSEASVWYQQFLDYKETVDYESQIAELETRISNYKHDLVRRHAHTFLSDLNATANLVRVPAASWVHLGGELFKKQIEHANSPQVVVGAIVLGLFSKRSSDEKADEARGKGSLALWDDLHKNWANKDSDAIGKNIKDLFIFGLEQHPELMEWFEQLFKLSLCSGWTAFEVLSEDLWEELVNESIEAAKNICQGSPINEDSKKLDLNLLFKHDFNLAQKMGSILKERYHFSNENGIMTAFADCLIYKPGQKKQITRNEALYQIEQKRHLIQHSGGIVDEDYRKKTHSALRVGERLRLTAKDLDDALIEITSAGFALLDRTDTWLENQKRIREYQTSQT